MTTDWSKNEWQALKQLDHVRSNSWICKTLVGKILWIEYHFANVYHFQWFTFSCCQELEGIYLSHAGDLKWNSYRTSHSWSTILQHFQCVFTFTVSNIIIFCQRLSCQSSVEYNVLYIYYIQMSWLNAEVEYSEESQHKLPYSSYLKRRMGFVKRKTSLQY